MKLFSFNRLVFGIFLVVSVAISPFRLVAEGIDFKNITITPSVTSLQVSFDYTRLNADEIQDVTLFVRDGKNDLNLLSPTLTGLAAKMMEAQSGRISLAIPLPYLPPGNNELVIRAKMMADANNKCLMSTNGRSLIQLNAYKGKNYELRCKISGDVIPFIRSQEGLSSSTPSWNFYYPVLTPSSMEVWAFKDNKWFSVNNPVPFKPREMTGWVDFAMRGQGNHIELEVDGQKISCTDANSYFSEGRPGFRSSDQGPAACIDDVVVTDLDTGKEVFTDDFERDSIGDNWKVCGGSWQITKGISVTDDVSLGTFNMPSQAATKLPKVETRKRGDGIDLFVNGNQIVPLFFSIAAPETAPYAASTYKVMRDVYCSGVRNFAPDIKITAFDKDGQLDLSGLDDIMAQSLAACPDSLFILRLALMPPPSLPQDERMKMARGQNDAVRQSGFEDTKVEQGMDASLASESYKKYINQELKHVVSHIQTRAYGRNILGMLVVGGGYEGNWGQCISFPSYLIDVSAAQTKHVGEALKAKYQTVEALRKAWDDNSASFDSPSLPGLEERSASDIAGFRDPSLGKSRRVLDFLDIYGSEEGDNLKSLYDAVEEAAPNSFFGNFYACTSNSEWGAGGAGFGLNTTFPLLDNPGAKFIAGILSYTDRRAGGVSANTSMTWESFRLHGKMLMSENDIKTPVTNELITEASWEDTAQTMRREFAFTFLMEHNALWFFDMGYTGPFYNNPIVLNEMSKELSVGKAALGLKRKNAAETLVVLDPNAWRYYAQTTEKLGKGAEPPFNCIVYPRNYSTIAVESMMRMGAPKDFILSQDLPLKDGYKLYMFPTAFHCDEVMRERVKKLAHDGAICLFMGPAGLIDDNSASLVNMERMLGMKIAFDGPMTLTASIILSNNPLAAGFSSNNVLGTGAYIRCFPNEDDKASWFRFYIDGQTPEVEVLAKYPDGKAAMAMRRFGKGAIVYSGVPLTNPTIYRNLAKLAGVHIYLDTDDALYADGNFVLIHTKEAGIKNVVLRAKAPEIREVFSGELVGRNMTKFEVKLPAKHTALYYIGKDAGFLKKLDDINKSLQQTGSTRELRQANTSG